MKRKILVITLLLEIILTVGIAKAGLISCDWHTAGDGLLTYDDETGLEWLDVALTLNNSINEIESKLQSGKEYDGFRYATPVEFKQLLKKHCMETRSTHRNQSPAKRLMCLLKGDSITYEQDLHKLNNYESVTIGTFSRRYGVFIDNEIINGYMSDLQHVITEGFILRNGSSFGSSGWCKSIYYDDYQSYYYVTRASPNIGHFLVRDLMSDALYSTRMNREYKSSEEVTFPNIIKDWYIEERNKGYKNSEKMVSKEWRGEITKSIDGDTTTILYNMEENK